MVRIAPHPVKKRSKHREQPKGKDFKLHNPEKNGKLSRSAGGLKVNWSRSRLEIHLRYVGSPEETRWQCELAGTKSLVRLPSILCSALG